MRKNTAKLEAILFAASDFVNQQDIAKILNIKSPELESCLEELENHLRDSGLKLIEHERSYQLATLSEFEPEIRSLQKTKAPVLSQPALEVLAIIAYRQPVDRTEIEQIRGVGSEQSIKNLLAKEFIAEEHDKTKTQVLYRTTGKFLSQLGLNHISKLPKINEPSKSN